ncbi:MAG: hypothetical protein ACJ72N_07045 [Labedaea sp.]
MNAITEAEVEVAVNQFRPDVDTLLDIARAHITERGRDLATADLVVQLMQAHPDKARCIAAIALVELAGREVTG